MSYLYEIRPRQDEQLISDNGIGYQKISGITILNNDFS